MMTLRQLAALPESIPATTAWYLADLGEAHGRQELFTRQAPQKLKVLREHAIIESAVSSNRLEGVEIDPARIGTVIFGHSTLRERNEEEIQGYRDALEIIHKQWAQLPVTEETLLNLHRLTRRETWDTGKYKEKDGDIVEKYPDGRQRLRFRPVSAAAAPKATQELV